MDEKDARSMTAPNAESVSQNWTAATGLRDGPDQPWVVLDYDGKPLPGGWATEAEAVELGLCGRYLLSGYGVARNDGSERGGK